MKSDGSTLTPAGPWAAWLDEFMRLLVQERDALERVDGDALARLSLAKAQTLDRRPGQAPEPALAPLLAHCQQANRANGALLHLRAQRIRALLGLDVTAPSVYGPAGGYLATRSASAVRARA